jgi:hypothetical protein
MLRYTPHPPKLKKGHDRLFSLITNYVNLISRPALIWIQSRIRDRIIRVDPADLCSSPPPRCWRDATGTNGWFTFCPGARVRAQRRGAAASQQQSDFQPLRRGHEILPVVVRQAPVCRIVVVPRGSSEAIVPCASATWRLRRGA